MSLISELKNSHFQEYGSILATYSNKIKNEIQSFSDLKAILPLLSPTHVHLSGVSIEEENRLNDYADNHKLLVIKALTKNDMAHFEKLILKDLPALAPSKKIAAIFNEFTQSNMVNVVLSQCLPTFFEKNPYVLDNFGALSDILDSFYIENADYVDAELLNLFLIMIGRKKIDTLIENNIDRFISILSFSEPGTISQIISTFSNTLLTTLMRDFENIKKLITQIFCIDDFGTLKMDTENANHLCNFLIYLEQKIEDFTLGNHFQKSENSHFISSLLRGKKTDTPENKAFMAYFNLANSDSDIDYLDILNNADIESSSWPSDFITYEDDVYFKNAVEISLEKPDTKPDFNHNKRKRNSMGEKVVESYKKQKLNIIVPPCFFQPVANKQFSLDLSVTENLINAIDITSPQSIVFNFAALLRELSRVKPQDQIEQLFMPYFMLIDYTLEKLSNSSEYPQLGGQIIARHNNAYNAHAILFTQDVNTESFKNYFIKLITLLNAQSNEIKEALIEGNQSYRDLKAVKKAKKMLADLFKIISDIPGVAHSNGLSA